MEDLGDNVTGDVLVTGDTGDAGEALDLGVVGVEGLLSEAKGPEFAAKAFKSSLLKPKWVKMGEPILSVRKVFVHEIFRET